MTLEPAQILRCDVKGRLYLAVQMLACAGQHGRMQTEYNFFVHMTLPAEILHEASEGLTGREHCLMCRKHVMIHRM